MEKGKLTLKDWFMATRPWSFTASGLSVVTMLCYMRWSAYCNWLNGVLATVAIVLFHAAGNMWSDYADYNSGVDAHDTNSVQTILSGQFRPKQIRNFALLLLIPACLLGILLTCLSGLDLLWIGAFGIVCTLCYPFFKYRALGDVVIIASYAVLPAMGTSYVAAGYIDWRVMWVAFPIGLLVDAILHANNTRDMVTDKRADIVTMAHGLGVKGSVLFYCMEQIVPYVWVSVLAVCGIFPLWSLAVLAVLPLSVKNCSMMLKYKSVNDAKEIVMLDQMSAQTQMPFCLVLSLSFIVAYFV